LDELASIENPSLCGSGETHRFKYQTGTLHVMTTVDGDGYCVPPWTV